MTIFLETERLILRQFTPDDVDVLTDLNSDPEVMRFLNGGQPLPREEIRDKWLPLYFDFDQKYGYGYFATIDRSSGRFIGWFHLKPGNPPLPGVLELGYRLRRDAWGRGYASEGSIALIRKGFELGATRITANTLLDNQASQRVMQKVGLKFDRDFHYQGVSGWHIGLPGVEYGIDRDEWLAAHPA